MDEQHDESKSERELPAWERMMVEVGRTFGVPTLLLLVLCYWFFWMLTPPMIDSMSRFVTATLQTQAQLSETQSDLAESQRSLVRLVEEVSRIANEIVVAERATQTDHMEQLEKLSKIEAAVTRPATPPKKAPTPTPTPE